jgi:RNA polymerase sigma factor (sigma-70 family)
VVERSSVQGLVTAAAGGERGAFDEIVRRFQDMAFAVAFGMLRESEAARDAAQDAFVEAYVHLRSLHDPAAFPAWFRRIVVKRADRLRRGRRPVVALESVVEFRDGAPDLAEFVIQRERATAVRTALSGLPEEKRAVLTLCCVEGLTAREAAAFLDLPLTTVKKRLHDARRRLRERLDGMAPKEMTDNFPSKTDDFARRVAFLSALRTGDAERVRALATEAPGLVNAPIEADVAQVGYYWPTGMTPLQWAAFTGDRTLVDCLLRAGADVAATGAGAMTPLHLATLMRRLEAAERLLAAGADANAITGKSGQTALHLARQRGASDLADLLLARGASPDIRDGGGRTPADWAELAGRPEPPVTAPGAMLETGLKVVDLLCPLARGGRSGVFTPLAGVGKLVLLCHLARIMASRYGGRTICVSRDQGDVTGEGLEVNFPEMGVFDGVTFIHDRGEPLALLGRALEEATGAADCLLLVEAELALPPGAMERLSAASPRTTVVFFGEMTVGAEPEPRADLDAAVTFDVTRARAGLFPAVDPLRSHSRVALAAPEHSRVASAVRRTLRRAADLRPRIESRGVAALSEEDAVVVRRADLLSQFLTQPIRGAEPWTNRPGAVVTLADTIAGCAAILSGERDATPPEELSFVGALPEP